MRPCEGNPWMDISFLFFLFAFLALFAAERGGGGCQRNKQEGPPPPIVKIIFFFFECRIERL